MSVFARFPPRLQDAIVSQLGWSSLRPVQELAAQAILDGHNALVLAPTAGGKTEAAVFPMLAQLLNDPPSSVAALYIAPIKALLNNQDERLGRYTSMVGLDHFLWHGDISASAKKAFQREPASLLMTTPESLEVMLLSAKVGTGPLFEDLRLVIIDEIHALAGQDRGAHLMSVLARLGQYSRHDLQRVGLSATVGNPTDILNWLQGPSKRPQSLIDPPKTPTPKDIKVSLEPESRAQIKLACDTARGKKSLLFCQSRALTEALAQELRGQGTEVYVHHSSVSLEERQIAEEQFQSGREAVIVCTSTLELGIDVGDLDCVLQAEAPSSVGSFLQRMGRTGRRPGSRAHTLFLCSETYTALQAAALVELARKGWVESVPSHGRCWPVLVHQLLALTLQFGGIRSSQCWELLRSVPDFGKIEEREFLSLIEHLLVTEFLFESGGLLSMGTEAERAFGRRNFMEIYSVFSTPLYYQVKGRNGNLLGTLEQSFVDKLVEGVSCFLLAGRAWVPESVFHESKEVLAVPAPRGTRPAWGGGLPQLLSYPLVREMAQILIEGRSLPYLNRIAQDSLAQLSEELGPCLAQRAPHLRQEQRSEILLTFAGGAVNNTLRHGLQVLGVKTQSSDNFRVKLAPDVSFREVYAALQELAQDDFWQNSSYQAQLLAALPEYRLSKFQQALPRAFAVEMLEQYLLDRENTQRFLTRE